MISTVLEVLGLACIAAAGFMVSVLLGVFLVGVILTVVGYQLGGEE